MRRDVRIVLVGDGMSKNKLVVRVHVPQQHFAESVGKSTIITSLIKESYVAHASVHAPFVFKPHLPHAIDMPGSARGS